MIMRRTLLTLAVLIAAATALQAADKYVKREEHGSPQSITSTGQANRAAPLPSGASSRTR